MFFFVVHCGRIFSSPRPVTGKLVRVNQNQHYFGFMPDSMKVNVSVLFNLNGL
jgi:hypothetical protein